MKINAIVTAAIMAFSLTALAQDSSTTTTTTTTTTQTTSLDQVFRADELSLDVFGSESVNQETVDHLSNSRIRENGRGGVGVGANEFVTRYLGFGADAYSENTSGKFIDDASGNIILRLPLDAIRLAPYIYGGGGHQFDPNYVWFGQFGGGVDFRVTQNLGFFADVRYVTPQQIGNFGVGRIGLRVVF